MADVSTGNTVAAATAVTAVTAVTAAVATTAVTTVAAEASTPTAPLPPEEYERRKAFLAELQGLSKSEYIEILRILKNHNMPFSENLNGVFFNLCSVSPEAFEALQLFRRFTVKNKEYLGDREKVMNTLTTLVGAKE
jgi:hypothetical protein